MTLRTKRDVERAHRQFMAGESFRDLAERYDMTHETIRQLFIRYGFSTNGGERRARREEKQEREARRRQDEIFESYRRHGIIEAVAEEVGLPDALVSKVIAKMPLRNIYRRRGVMVEGTEERVIEALRKAYRLTDKDRPLTTTFYRRMAPAYGWPALHTINRLFNDFYEACQVAGVPANPSRGRYSHSYTEEDCLEAIKRCARQIRHAPSYDQYREWQQAHRDNPSGPTIRVIIGPWTEAIQAALGS